jgi:hypothetical protein
MRGKVDAALRSRWGRRAFAVYVVVCLAAIGVALDGMHPEVRAKLAQALRDPAMDLPGPFRNCAAAQAAGFSDIPRGSPAYVPWQDADGDGFACEPYGGGRSGGALQRRLARLRTLVR